MRPTRCHGDKADKARLLTLVVPQSHEVRATGTSYCAYEQGGAPGHALQPPQEGRLFERRLQRGRGNRETERKVSSTRSRTRGGLEGLNGQEKIREWSLERREEGREELREGDDKRKTSRKSVGEAQKDFAVAGENPAVQRSPGQGTSAVFMVSRFC